MANEQEYELIVSARIRSKKSLEELSKRLAEAIDLTGEVTYDHFELTETQ